MAQQSRSAIKQWYQTLDTPNQDNFWDWLDSFFHKDDAIPMANITNLQTTLNGLAPIAAVQYALPIIETNAATTYNKLFDEGVIIDLLQLKSTTNATVVLKFNTVDYIEIELVANVAQVISLVYPCNVATTLTITSLPINSQIKIYKR